jgi:tRNA U34 5-methylaminomethyl-2-thiouridine-forming methyltransferase MnmC
MPAIGIMAAKDPHMWRKEFFKIIKEVFSRPQVHKRMESNNHRT